MNEKLHKRNKGRTLIKEEAEITAKNSYGRKLRGETAQSSTLKKKLRAGKADTAESVAELKKKAKMREQGRRKSYADTVLTAGIHHLVDTGNEDENTAADVIEQGLYHSKMSGGRETGKPKYSGKLHTKAEITETKNPSKEIQKKRIKKEMQQKAIKRRQTEGANLLDKITKKLIQGAGDPGTKIAEAAAENPLGFILGAVIMIVILIMSANLGSCAMFAGSGNTMVISTSFTARDYVIVDVEEDYTAMETALRDTINGIESTYPGYDEYNYSVADIGHDPFELASLLTILFNAYTESQVQDVLGMIYGYQYSFTVTEVIETRISIDRRYDFDNHEYYETQEEYEYKILNVSLSNNGIQAAVDSFGLNIGDMQRYQVMVELKGNKPYVFD